MPSSTTYNPLGMESRSVSSEAYRFGFQGQEKDPEWTGQQGSHLAFKYRIHDARIGRFLSIDPLTKDYPWNSPYAFSENRVIDKIEFEGLEMANPPINYAPIQAKREAESVMKLSNSLSGKITFSADIGLTSGKVGANINAMDIGIGGSAYPNVGSATRLKVFCELDFDRGYLNIGVSHLSENIWKGSSYHLGLVNGEEKEFMETEKSLSIIMGAEKDMDDKYKKEERDGFSVFTLDDNSDENSFQMKSGVGVNALMIGIEASSSISYKDSEQNMNSGNKDQGSSAPKQADNDGKEVEIDWNSGR
jgi:RHS repeat-associated protein